jgi:hypothetical protein
VPAAGSFSWVAEADEVWALSSVPVQSNRIAAKREQ